MDNHTYNSIVNFIWGIAKDCLRNVYVRGKYRDVILPMTVIRRLDAVLEPTKAEVLKGKKQLDIAGVREQTLSYASGKSFWNSSPFRLKDLTGRAKQQTLKADFIAYLDGFSPNVKEILSKFKFRVQIDTMVDANILGAVIEKFVDPKINLSPEPVRDDVGGIRLPGLDNRLISDEVTGKLDVRGVDVPEYETIEIAALGSDGFDDDEIPDELSNHGSSGETDSTESEA
jgi:type I restriction enzyme M protein